MRLYGIDWSGPIPVNDDEGDSTVVVPDTKCPLDENDLQELQQTISPTSSQNYGIDLFMACLAFVQQKLSCHEISNTMMQ